MKSLSLFAGAVAAACLTAGAAADMSWSENFDDYVTGSEIIGQGGWEGWYGDAGAGAFVTGAQSHSGPHSLDITPDADVVRQFSNKDSGQYTVTGWQYVPQDFVGVSFFILLNSYDGAGGAAENWSTQVQFNGDLGVVHSDFDGAELPLITNEWVELRLEIDLDADTQDFFYGNDLLYSKSWTDGVSGGGASSIGALNLFANAGSSSVYYDDLQLLPTPAAAWLLLMGAAVGRRRRSPG